MRNKLFKCLSILMIAAFVLAATPPRPFMLHLPKLTKSS